MTHQASNATDRQGKEEATTFPRVLVVSANPFNRVTNNGITLSSLFGGWPRDRLAQIFVPFATHIPPQSDVCEQLFAVHPLGVERVVAPRDVGSRPPSTVSVARKLLLKAAQSKRMRHVAPPIREYFYSWRAGSGGVRGVVESFNPEVIFSTLGSLSLVRLAQMASHWSGAPVVPFVTDDWPTTEYVGALLGKALRQGLLAEFEAILRKAPVRMVISPAMGEAYEERYGGDFLPFTQCLDAERYDPSERPPSECVRLIYAGQIGAERWRQIKRIGRILEELAKEGVRAELLVYTMPEHIMLYGRELDSPPFVRMAGNVPSHELPSVYRDADILLHVESFDPKLAAYTRYSLSTKVSEYMMAGRCIFAFGPAAGSIRYVAQAGAGLVVTADDEAQVAVALRELIRDRSKRHGYARRGREVALRSHEGTGQRIRFKAALMAAAEAALDPATRRPSGR